MTIQPPPGSVSSAATEPTTPVSHNSWWLLVRGIEVRLRFFVLLGGLALIMAGWPWLRSGWDRVASLWHRHDQAASVSGDIEFFCPMDPGVISSWPAICPICNMDLITRKKSDAVILPEGVVARMQLSPYRIQLAGIRTSPVDGTLDVAEQGGAAGTKPLLVPTSAIVRHAGEDIVYVETMPGMFDGVCVQLGPRENDFYPILAGLKPGQRVVTTGAFLIDAESRLHPNATAQYFGAGTNSRQPELPRRRTETRTSAEPLSDDDLAQIKQQRICPVTEAPLGSMGTPVFATVQGRKVFLCCRGCEAGLLANPDKFLARLKPPAGEVSQ